MNALLLLVRDEIRLLPLLQNIFFRCTVCLMATIHDPLYIVFDCIYDLMAQGCII
jgi:hypothetical protein